MYDEWRVFGMMNLIRNPLIIDFGKRLFVAMSYSLVQFGSISIHDRTGSLNVYSIPISNFGDFHSKGRQFQLRNRFCSGVRFALKAVTVLH